MAIDIFTPEVLDAIVTQMPTNPSFFRDTFFGKRPPKLLPTTTVRAEFKKGSRVTAPFVNEKGGGKVLKKRGYTSEPFDTPLLKPKDVTDIEQLLKRLMGENFLSPKTPADRAMELMAEQLGVFNEAIDRRIELMCAMSMMEGVIHVVGEDVDYDIDFGFTNTGTVSNLWDGTSGDPIADLTTISNTVLATGYVRPNVCIMHPDSYAAFLKGLTVSGKMDQLNINVGVIKPTIINPDLIYVGYLNGVGLEIYSYAGMYTDDWTNAASPTDKYFVPKGKILVASTAVEYSLYFGLLTRLDQAAQQFVSEMAIRMADTWVSKEPDARMMALMSRPLPVPHQVDSWYVATVAATT